MKWLFTHTDLDGAGCRVLWEYYFPKEFPVYNCGNSEIDDIVESCINEFDPANDEVVFADICPSVTVLKKLKMIGVHVEIFDHHKTNLFAYDVFNDAIVIPTGGDNWECGTSLMYQMYIEQEMLSNREMINKFVDTVRSYDTFEFKRTGNPDAKKLQTLFFMLGMGRFCDLMKDYLRTATELIPPTCNLFIDARLEQEQKSIDEFIQECKAECLEINGYNVAFVIGSNGINSSDLANQYLSTYQGMDVFATYFPITNVLSFRAVRDDIDVGVEFAKPLGGGGHPKAAGTPLPPRFKEVLYRTIQDYLNECYKGFNKEEDKND